MQLCLFHCRAGREYVPEIAVHKVSYRDYSRDPEAIRMGERVLKAEYEKEFPYEDFGWVTCSAFPEVTAYSQVVGVPPVSDIPSGKTVWREESSSTKATTSSTAPYSITQLPTPSAHPWPKHGTDNLITGRKVVPNCGMQPVPDPPAGYCDKFCCLCGPRTGNDYVRMFQNSNDRRPAAAHTALCLHSCRAGKLWFPKEGWTSPLEGGRYGESMQQAVEW